MSRLVYKGNTKSWISFTLYPQCVPICTCWVLEGSSERGLSPIERTDVVAPPRSPDNTTLSPTPVLQPKNEPGISLMYFCSCPKACEFVRITSGLAVKNLAGARRLKSRGMPLGLFGAEPPTLLARVGGSQILCYLTMAYCNSKIYTNRLRSSRL